jgi:uncharacterized protein YkwD
MHRNATILPILMLILVGLLALTARAAMPAAQIALPLLSCPGCAGPTPTRTPGLPTPEPSEYAMEAVRLINEARLAAGCPAAVPHPALMAATQEWSEYMASSGIYHHAPSEHYSKAPYFYDGGVLENIGGGYSSQDIVDAWLDSPIHKSNVEFCYSPNNPSYNPDRIYDIGVGYSNGYWIMALGWQ